MKSRIAPNDIEMHAQIAPRVIRHRDAPAYLGMDRNRFDAEVRPGVTEVAMGQRGIAFDRLELDAWWETHMIQSGRPGRAVTNLQTRSTDAG